MENTNFISACEVAKAGVYHQKNTQAIKDPSIVVLDEKRDKEDVSNSLAMANKYAPDSGFEKEIKKIFKDDQFHLNDLDPSIAGKNWVYSSTSFPSSGVNLGGFGLSSTTNAYNIGLINGWLLMQSKVNYGTTVMIDIPRRSSLHKARYS